MKRDVPVDLEELFDAAVGMSGAEQAALLARLRKDDAAAADELAELLRCDAEAGRGFLGGPAEDGPEPRTVAERYELIELLGRGGQGAVYRAHDTKLDRAVAVKFLTATHFMADESRERFRREAEIASKLDHPGICSVYDAGVEGGTPWIAMRLVDGAPLSSWIETKRERGGVPSRQEIDRTLALFERAAAALHFAHEAGIVHRDVKPHNVLVAGDGTPVLLDFGIARDDTRAYRTLTRTGEVFGTPAYMSPELIAAGTVDRGTDVWALGVSLYECLTLEHPFGAPTVDAIYHRITRENPPDPRRRNPAIPRDLAIVLETGLEKDRACRYLTAGDFADDLQRVREHRPILARPVSVTTKLRRWTQRNPLVTASLVLAFASLIVGLVASLLALAEERATRRQRDVALRGYERMSDAALCDDLLAGVHRLWPLEAPATAPALAQWLGDATELLARREAHERLLDELEERAEPYDEKAREADRRQRRAANPAGFTKLDKLRAALTAARRRLAAAGSGADSRPLQEVVDRYERLTQDTARRLRADERLTWRFAGGDYELLFKHQVQAKLVRGLRRLAAVLPAMRAGHETARTVHETSLVGAADAWRACIDDVRGTGGGLERLAPILGLVPLGRDKDSGLWEFWHVASGPRPVWEGTRTAGAVRRDGAAGLVLVLIPGGSFLMGAQAADRRGPGYDRRARPAEAPPTTVTLSPFFLSKFELTQAQWSRLQLEVRNTYAAGMRRRVDITAVHPVTDVSWHDAMEATRRLGLQLPTEEQWEYAARAGTRSGWSWGNSVRVTSDSANVADEASRGHFRSGWQFTPGLDDGYAVHAPVGSFRANPWGLCDMHGNVWEWCRSEGSDYRSPPRAGDGLRAPSVPRMYVSRGGSFQWPVELARSGFRRWFSPDNRPLDQGLRPARGL